MSFVKHVFVLAALIAPSVAFADTPQVGGASRLATFEDAEGKYFALSVKADERASYPEAENYEVVVLFDTSASQSGQIRTDALEVLDELGQSFSTATSVSLIACDVETVPLTEGLVSVSDPAWETAVARLEKRVPLGTTNLSAALRTAAGQFTAGDAQRTIVYIGDGVNRTNFLTSKAQRKLIDELVASRVSVSALAIGPFVDFPTLASLANHTGGIVLVDSQITESSQSIGRFLAHSTSVPVLWVEDAKLPGGLASHFPATFPPMRLDRDTVVVGRTEENIEGGKLVVAASCNGEAVSLAIDVEAEASNPDMGFLVSVVDSARKDGGFTLPALGSQGLRVMSFMLAESAEAMVKTGRYALQIGEIAAAERIANAALKQDPNSEAALSLLRAATEDEETEVPAGKFMQFGGQDVGSEYDSAGELLAQEDAFRRAAAAALKADVRNQLSQAQKQSAKDPTGVKNSLKLLLEELDGAVDVDAALRAQLQADIRSQIQVVAAKEARFLDRVQRAEAIRSQQDQIQRLLAETERDEEYLKNLVDQFNFLMVQQDFLAASKEVAPEIGEVAPDSVLHNVTREVSSLLANQALLQDVFEQREQGFVDAMRGVEAAAVPFDGVPPLIYPPAEVWQALSIRRKERYGSINLAGSSNSEQKIYSALKQKVDASFPGQPLQTVVTTLADQLSIPIWINSTELEAFGVDVDTPVTLDLPEQVSLRSALRIMLKPLELTYIIRNEVLEITSIDDADSDPINKVYPVGDLVVPPTPMGGMMGGMGGGMGGMGGGMGGMGGMGGGMMGGMGGGMFAVPDDSSRSETRSPLAPRRSTSGYSADEWISAFEKAEDEQRTELDGKLRRLIQSKVESASAFLEAKANDQAVAEFQEVTDLISGLITAGYPQPWMYQTLSLSMEACKYPQAEIKRVLLSGLDFGGDSDHSFKLAKYFVKRGMKAEALELLRDIAVVEPFRYDVFALALPLADELQDLDALRWTCTGILSKAWPKEQGNLYRAAQIHAKTTGLRLAQQGRVVEATAFENEIKQAGKRDLAVQVNWSGNADLDIRVREPSGSICSLSNPRTIGGGVLLGDASSASDRASIDGFSERYVCSEGFAGQYEILIRRVWGDVAGGKATVVIFTHYGTDKEQRIVKQIDIGETASLVSVAIDEGSRKEAIEEAQIASIRRKQIATSQEINGEAQVEVLAQFEAAADDSSSSSADYYNFRRQIANNTARRRFGFPGAGAVGYMPTVTTLMDGANLSVSGVVSADRRYVRLSPTPFFSGIGEVFTYNLVTGGQGQNQGGAGGIGGAGGGGIGGGAGGGQGGFGF